MSEGVKTGLRVAGLVTIFALCALAWKTGAVRALYWPSLVAHRDEWAAFVHRHEFTAPFAYILIYALAVALSLPVGLWLSLLSGLLFGVVLGSFVTVIGASGGAIALYLLARGLLAPFLNKRLSGPIDRLRGGIERDEFSYLLALRLMPVFPFWLVNLAPALIGMRLLPYSAATILGMIPTSFVLNAVGAGLSDTLADAGQPNAGMLLTPQILLPLLALAVLAVLPALWRQWKQRTLVRPSSGV